MKVFFDTIGCRLNQSEIEKMAAQARANGHEVVARAAQADVVIINTCAVTLAASSDSRMKIRQAARADHARIIATGCYATIAPEEVGQLPQVSDIILNQDKDRVIQSIFGRPDAGGEPAASARVPLPGRQHRTRAFIKVQDGCDNFCTFCITRIARGRSISQPKEEIYQDIAAALKGGAKEIVLTGVNLGSWGKDHAASGTLVGLIKEIIADFAPGRLRLSSLEPWDIDEDFLEVLTLPGFCRHLHLPLQSGSQGVLQRMGRRNTPQDFLNLLEMIRKTAPDIAITTDIMVGFPGETQAEFEESLEFVRSLNLAGGHVFNYSLRPGTPAEGFPDRIPPAVRKERSESMRAVIESSRQAYQSGFLGRVVQVLWEQAIADNGIWQMEGLTDHYLRIRSEAETNLQNEFSDVFLLESHSSFAAGKILTGKNEVQ
jgi:threonylcarbamoyladenosine tRNA methylthiotransferase MtaB